MTFLPHSLRSHFRFSFVALSTVAGVTFSSHCVAADAMYLLQLGSFDTERQAQQKWQELKDKNTAILGSLTLHVSPVSMSDDGAVIYRTQAGPVDSRSKASELCAALTKQGAECYVVETAMLNSDIAPAPDHDETAASASASRTITDVAPSESAVASPPSTTVTFISGREPKFLDMDAAPAETVSEPSAVAAVAESKASAHAAEAHEAETASSQERTHARDESISVIASESSSPAAQRVSNPFAKKRTVLAQTKKKPATVVASSATESETHPSPAPEKKGGFFSRLFGSSSSEEKTQAAAAKPEESKLQEHARAEAPPAAKVEGDVNVAEAIRVPLSDSGSHTTRVTLKVPRENARTEQVALGNSQYWAQVSYFPDEASAQNFYEEFRNAYPDMSEGVRMRITRPYATSSRGGRVTLRMGAFVDRENVDTVCELASQQHLNCVSVKSARAASSGVAARNESPAPVSDTPFTQAPDSDNAVYAGQIGVFTSTDAAWDKWKTLQKIYKKTLAKTQATVVSSSADNDEKPTYELRVGPFTNRSTAVSLCDKLIKRVDGCRVTQVRQESLFTN